MEDSEIRSLYQDTLDWMGGLNSSRGPRPILKKLAEMALLDEREISEADLGSILSALSAQDTTNFYSSRLAIHLRNWDASDASSWIGDTLPYSEERRALSMKLLELPDNITTNINELFPIYRPDGHPIVIAEEHEDWYSEERKQAHNFYWAAYKDYLSQANEWPEESIIALDKSSDMVVERLSDPERREIKETKGLVVGYVQSGKTANFTAVVAKAADAGYRLIIVIAGTLNILRDQTQRRFDKELIGKEIIESAGSERDYLDAKDWEAFISHGSLPSTLGGFDWKRLTGEKEDYKRLRRGLEALEFRHIKQGRRFNDPVNLHPAPAVLLVVKKIPSVLRKLNKDLQDVRTRLEEVPAIIIDDESDQASVNTVDPTKEQKRTRTATNEQIIKLIKTLPRAQYVGYTATPFANVFINPTDAEDLFPRDYIISLPRPKDYMGIYDFFDFDEDLSEPGESAEERPKETAHIKGVIGEDEDPENLPRAVDSFILTGAIKLFRKSKGIGVSTKHHTMLVHRSVKQAEHEADSILVRKIYDDSNPGSRGFYERLEKLWEEDFNHISSKYFPDLVSPRKFEELKPFIDDCVSKIGHRGESAVRVVNGDRKFVDHIPNFDRDEIWSILVGGTKLSRGYTVEGLTISYYRRIIKMADTLMQVGRWFGFRRGYKDLVRLYVGRAEPHGRHRKIDMYAAFKSICRDEEAFRLDLEKYADTTQDPRILPINVPPLVPSHLLPPTAKNKMWHATVTHQNFGEKYKESGRPAVTPAERKINAELTAALVDTAESLGEREIAFEKNFKQIKWTCFSYKLSLAELTQFLEAYRWSHPGYFQRELEFLKGTGDKDPEVDTCILLIPQKVGESGATWREMSVFGRTVIGDRFGSFSEPRHRDAIEAIALNKAPPKANAALTELIRRESAAMLIYPTVAKGDELQPGAIPDSKITIGFGIKFPKNRISAPVTFGAVI